MKINWILRLQNKATLTSFIMILIVVVYQFAKLSGFNIPVEQQEVLDLCQGIITLFCILGIVVDPTTEGVGDSNLALAYKEPRNSDNTPIIAVTPSMDPREGGWEVISTDLPPIDPQEIIKRV